MGMYTELIFGAELKHDTPDEVINTLRYLVGDIDIKPDPILWTGDRNPLNGSSFSFGVNRSVSKMWYCGNSKCWHISTRANIKNYSGEIENFLDWVKPYIESGSGDREMYAIQMYEEFQEPEIYYLYEKEIEEISYGGLNEH